MFPLGCKGVIVDLAVGLATGRIKADAPCRCG